MQIQSNPKSFLHFIRHIYHVSHVYMERNKAKAELEKEFQRLRKSIFRMTLSYYDIDKLRNKLDSLTNLERKYARFFKPNDDSLKMLAGRVVVLENNLRDERLEKQKIIDNNKAYVQELNADISDLKQKMMQLYDEKTRRRSRLTALEKKICSKVDVHKYFHPSKTAN